MRVHFESSDVTIYQADSREAWKHLPEHSADAIVTSPPYWGLRDYGVDGQIGLEDSPDVYVAELADLLTGYGTRVLKPQGSLWLNLGDTYGTGTKWGGATGGKHAAGLHGTDGRHGRRTFDMPDKCLLMIPERVAFALIDRGWILRNKVVWAKPNGMPSSVQDRLATKWEYVFHFVRQQRYHYDLDAIRDRYADDPSTRRQGIRAERLAQAAGLTREHRDAVRRHCLGEDYAAANRVNGRPPSPLVEEARAVLGSYLREWAYTGKGANPGDVWVIPTQPYPEAHFAVFPPELVRRPILATVPEGGTVLDPFFGSGTTGVMARRLGRRTVGVELNPDYCALAADRFREDVLPLGGAG